MSGLPKLNKDDIMKEDTTTTRNFGLPKLNQEKKTEKFDLEEDFKIMTFEEQLEEDEIEEENIHQEKNKDVDYTEEVEIIVPTYTEISSKVLIEQEKNEYIDKKNKKILPLGGEKSKIKSKIFDGRKNLIVSIKIVRLFLMIVILGLFALGIKNTYFPVQIYTPREIEWIAMNAVGNTGFPLDMGADFVKEFIKNYIENNTPQNRLLLNYFYSGEIQNNTNYNIDMNKKDSKDNLQKVISGPVILDKYSVTPETAVYKVSVLVSDTNGEIINQDRTTNAHWLTFFVNVYYNHEEKLMAIHKDSPTMIQNVNLTNPKNIPSDSLLGNGQTDDSLIDELSPTIDGFIVGFAKSSPEYNSEVTPFIPSTKPRELVDGFRGAVRLEKDKKTSIKKIVYLTDDPNQYKVDTYVNWIDNESSSHPSVYTSRYVTTVQRTGDGGYLVVKFAPYLYEPQN